MSAIHERLLATLAERTRGHGDPSEIVEVGMALLREALDVERCAYAEVERDEDHFTFLGSAQAPGIAPAGGRFPVSAFGREALDTMRAGRTYVAGDILAEGARRAAAGPTQIRGLIAVPMIREGRLVAGTGVHAFAPRAWTPDEVALAEAVTSRCWEAIERARAEASLRRSEARFRAIVDGQTEMLCRFGRDGTILFVNRAYAQAQGRSAEELEGSSFWQFIPPAERPGVQAILDRLTPDAPEVRIENALNTVGGERWTLWTNRALVFDGEGRWVEAQSAGIDITERKQAELALREADERKTRFIAMLAHELRNPLAPIRTGAELIARLGVPHQQQRRALEIIERQARHLARLVDDLLDAARLESGKVAIVREEVDLGGVVAASVEVARPLVEAKGIELHLELPEVSPRVSGDRTRLVQVLDNLLHNAAKYTPERGLVTVALAVADGSATLEVRDDGSGIQPELLPRVFEPFVQGDASLDRSRGGLGLGLTLVKELVALHGGEVSAHSPGPGGGTTVRVVLPLLASTGTPSRTTARSEAGPKRRVLLVEDNVDAAELLAEQLELDGHEVKVAHDGPSALRIVSGWTPEVVLCDLGLPGMSGFEVAEALRRDRRLAGVRLVAISGYGREEDRVRSRAAGFGEHLVKPVDVETLEAILTE